MLKSQTKTYTAAVVLSKAQLEAYYQGAVKDVQVRETSGLAVRFPLQALRQFVGHEGISGVFQIKVSSDNRLLGIQKLSEISYQK